MSLNFIRFWPFSPIQGRIVITNQRWQSVTAVTDHGLSPDNLHSDPRPKVRFQAAGDDLFKELPPPMNPFFYREEAGAKGLPPLSPAPPIPAEPPPLRSGQFRLTIPNTYSTITMSASLRSDCCSPSLRNAVRLPSGISVHLHRNTLCLA